MATRETESDNDGACGGGSDVAMGGLIIRRCDCGDRDNIRDASTVDVVCH